MKRLCLLLLLCMVFLSGCMSREVEEQLLVILMGVDRMEDGNLVLTVKVPSNTAGDVSASSSSEDASKGGNQMGYLTLSATGHHFSDALELLLATTPRSLNFSQVREVVISRQVAETKECTLLLQKLYSLPRMHTQAVVVICDGEAGKFVEEQKPYVGSRLSRYIEVSLQNYAGKGFVPTTSLAQAVQEIGYGWQDPLLILGALPQDKEGAPEKENVLNVDADQLHATSINAVKLFGAAATDGEKVSGTLTGYEMALVSLMLGQSQSLSLWDDQGFSLPLYARAPATLRVEGEEKLMLTVSMVCEVHYRSTTPPDEEKIRGRLEDELESTLRKLQSLRCDALGFGGRHMRRFATVQAWENFNWREKYARADVQVDVQLRLKKE
ncbi:MAG: hypothetical protein IJO67_01480 [Clostridia bacterium]|nr:hypothetical protein [Clostridia bacterium]